MLLERWKPATAHTATAGCTLSTAGWRRKTTCPARWQDGHDVPDQPVPVLTEPQLRTLFAVRGGKDFEARRDTALLMVLDAGPRRAELLGMRLEDLDFEYDVVRVIGKGGRERALPFGRKTGSWPWIATYASGHDTGSPALRPCDQPAWAAHHLRAVIRLDRRARQVPVSPTCTSVPAHLRPRVAQCRRHRGRPMRIAAGGPARCSPATAPRLPMRVPEMPTVAFRRTIGCGSWTLPVG